MRDKLLEQFGHDPLYYRVLTAKDEDAYRDAVEILANIRGHKAVVQLQEAAEKLKKDSNNT